MTQTQAENEASKRSKKNHNVVYVVLPKNMTDYAVYAEQDVVDTELIICKFKNGRIID
jgi:hypothetical protein